MTTIESVLPSKSFEPLPLEGADERSEAGLASLNVGVPFHAANLRPYHFFSRGKRRGAWHMWGKRESLTANDNGFSTALGMTCVRDG